MIQDIFLNQGILEGPEILKIVLNRLPMQDSDSWKEWNRCP